MKRWQIILVEVALALLCLALSVGADDLPVPPEPQQVWQLTCRITGTAQGWQVVFHAAYRPGKEERPDWQKLYSVRPSIERAAKDCEKWFKKTRQAQKEIEGHAAPLGR